MPTLLLPTPSAGRNQSFSFLADRARLTDGSVVKGRNKQALRAILHAKTDMVLWARTLPDELRHWVDACAPRRLPHGRILSALRDLPKAVASLVPGRSRGEQLLHADIVKLAWEFALIARSGTVDVRLDKIDHNACWRFHRDRVGLRLLVTYRGPGAQLPPFDLAEEAMNLQRAYKGPLTAIPRGVVALFKGSSANGERGVVHRSPPISDSGTTRLLLCLNTRSQTSPLLWREHMDETSDKVDHAAGDAPASCKARD